MGELIPITKDFKESAREFLEMVEQGKISHGVFVYRTTEGELMWKTFGNEHKTYLCGLIERVKHRLLEKADEEGQWAEWDTY